MKEFLELLKIKFIVAWKNFIEFLKVAFKYYRHWKFFLIDQYLLRSYILRNPYRIAKQFAIEKGEKEIYTYGETPLTTADEIAKICGIVKDDVVFELGSGRGRACFWLNHFIGCEVIGIEIIPEFVDIARRTKRKYNVKNITFHWGDILKWDYKKATVIYFYGTCSENEFISKLIEKVAEVKVGTKIITVSYPLSDYTGQNLFEIVKVFPANFTWGTADVYLQRRL